MEQRIKSLRLNCDKLAGVINHYSDASNQMLSAKQSLLFAKAWMGKMLGAMGVDSPYQNDGKRNVIEDIEPTAERYTLADGETYAQVDQSYINIIDMLRSDIAVIVENVEGITSSKGGRKTDLMKENVYSYLCEARFHLGFELERLRELANEPEN